MAYVVGIDQFFKHSTSVGGGRNTTGVVTGGSGAEKSANLIKRSIGSWKPAQIRDGLVTVEGTVKLDVQSEGILALAERDGNGDLTEFDIEFGNASESVIHKNCKIDALTLECSKGESLAATIGWKGKYSSSAEGSTHSPSGDAILQWFECELGGISGELTGFTFNIGHNVEDVPICDSSGSPKRSAKYRVEKGQDLTANLKFLAIEGTNLMAASISYVASATITFTGTNTVVLTMTNMKIDAHSRDLSPEDLIEFGADYDVQDFTITTS